MADYVSNGPTVYSDNHPPLFDKYHFFNSSGIMAGIGRRRASKDGLRTLEDLYINIIYL